MKLWKVERMTEKDYHKMMGGSWNYQVETVYIDADTAHQAVLKAGKPGYRVNDYAVEVTD